MRGEGESQVERASVPLDRCWFKGATDPAKESFSHKRVGPPTRSRDYDK